MPRDTITFQEGGRTYDEFKLKISFPKELKMHDGFPYEMGECLSAFVFQICK